MRRLISLLVVMLVMAAMVLAMAMPALAEAAHGECGILGLPDASCNFTVTDSGNINGQFHYNTQQ